MRNHGIDALSGSLGFIGTELPLNGIALVVGVKGCVIIAAVFMGFTQSKGKVIFVGTRTIESRILAHHGIENSIIKFYGLKISQTPIRLTGTRLRRNSATIGLCGRLTFSTVTQSMAVTRQDTGVIRYLLEHLSVLLVGVLKATGHRQHRRVLHFMRELFGLLRLEVRAGLKCSGKLLMPRQGRHKISSGDMKIWGQLKAAFQQVDRLIDHAQINANLGE